jgi:hypothetical protein
MEKPDTMPLEHEVEPVAQEQGLSLISELVEITELPVETAIYDETETSSESIQRFGYAEFVPSFDEIIMDTTRTNTFTYLAKAGSIGAKGFSDETKNKRTLTEFEGLNGLYGFLSRSRDTLLASGNQKDKEFAFIAEDILANLSFIGEKEMIEASRGIADYWKMLLRDNPNLQICVLNEVSAKMGTGKSDRYILSRVLDNFSEEERDEFDGRVKLDLDEISSAPEDTKVIMLEDWSISGLQMRTSFGLVSKKLESLGLLNNAEVHLLVASPSQIENGIHTTTVDDKSEVVILPVKSYYLADEAPSALKPAKAIISGVHSAVNYDFEIPIHDMVRRLREIEGEFGNDKPSTVMPPLTNIRSEYR